MSIPVCRREAIGMVAGATAAAGIGAPALARATAGRQAAMRLRCEWRVDPLGVDTLRPRFHWEIPQGSEPRGARVIVATSAAALRARHGDLWDSGAITGRPWTRVPRPLRLESHRVYHWAVALTDAQGREHWSAAARFTTGILDPAEWRGQWIAAGPDFAPRPPHVRGHDMAPPRDPAEMVLPLLRKRFDLDRRPTRAMVSMAGLGHGTLSVNGRAATDALIEPGWTEYARTILYATYDVTDLITSGANVLGVMLGNGMFHSDRAKERKAKFADSYGRPRLMLLLSLDFADGTRRTIVSDASWSVTEGPIRFSSIFGGEDVDARRTIPGWDRPGSPAGQWRPATVLPGPGGKLRAQGIEPVRVHRTFDTVALTEPKPGVLVYDLGTNFAGRPVLKVRGRAGQTVKLIPAEVLGEDGLFWQRSFNAGPGRMVEYNFTLAGSGEEVFKPQFNYHGFRYLQVEGATRDQIVAVQGEFMHADLPQTGSFDCASKLFVDTHQLIERAVLSNAVSVFTDCPHREKLGWLEQMHLNALTVFYNRDAAAHYEKMIVDIADSQRRSDGMVPGIAPEYMEFLKPDGSDDNPRSSPEWGAAVILAPWAAYRFYGDPQVLNDGYPAMQRYAEYLAGMAKGDIVDFGLGDWYDVGPDKLGASQLTSRALSGTATWYQALTTLAAIGRIIGRPAAEARAYEAKAAQVRAAFNARFFDVAKGSYDRGSQTANAMPLTLGMVPAGQEKRVLDALVAAVRASRNGVTAGDVGFHYVVRALTEHGRDDVLFDMMSVTDRPSYGYQLARGATALAESWSADPTKSLNHFMLGHGEGWLFGGLAGLQVDFTQDHDAVLTIAPRPVGDIAHASASLRTVLGTMSSAWRRSGGRIALDVTVPPGATATIVLPTGRPDQAMAGTRAIADAPGIVRTRAVPGGLEIVARGGSHRFAAPFGTV